MAAHEISQSKKNYTEIYLGMLCLLQWLRLDSKNHHFITHGNKEEKEEKNCPR